MKGKNLIRHTQWKKSRTGELNTKRILWKVYFPSIIIIVFIPKVRIPIISIERKEINISIMDLWDSVRFYSILVMKSKFNCGPPPRTEFNSFYFIKSRDQILNSPNSTVYLIEPYLACALCWKRASEITLWHGCSHIKLDD